MSTAITFNGVGYSVPSSLETNWASLSAYLIALSSGTFQRAGGSFTLTADADFGANYGLVSIYFKSRTANISDAGIVRLANTDQITFRNGANSGNLTLGIASDRLQFGGVNIPTISSADTFTNKTLTSPTLTGPTITGPIFSGLTASTVPYLDASKILVSSAVTPTQLGYLGSATGTSGTTSTNLVFSTNPTFITPTLGVFNATQGSKIGGANGSLTAPTTSNTNLLLYNNSASNWAGIGAATGGEVYISTGSSGTPITGFYVDILGGNVIGRAAGGNAHTLRAAATTVTYVINTTAGAVSSLTGFQNATTGTLGFVGFDSSSNAKIQNSSGGDLISANSVGVVTLGAATGTNASHTFRGSNGSPAAFVNTAAGNCLNVYQNSGGTLGSIGFDNGPNFQVFNLSSASIMSATNAGTFTIGAASGSSTHRIRAAADPLAVENTAGNANIGFYTTGNSLKGNVNFDTSGNFNVLNASGAIIASSTSVGLMTLGASGAAAGLIINNATASYSPSTFNYYESGTFTGTCTGFTTGSQTVTVRFVRVGDTVTLHFPQGPTVATSNATTFTITGLPARLQTARTVQCPVIVGDNSVVVSTPGMARLTTGSGTITFFKDLAQNAFTAAGNKSIQDCTIQYVVT